MSTDPFNTNEAFRSADGKGFVRSVSIIFYVPNRGYLLCSEMRKGFPIPENRTHENHMIGGKVDLTDKSALECGLREFCEETGYRSYHSSSGEMNIKDSVKMMITKFKKCPTVKWDYCVSPKKGMYNRFYVICLNNHNDFSNYINSWKKKENLPIESLYFWNKGDLFERKSSSLLQTFIDSLPEDNIFLN